MQIVNIGLHRNLVNFRPLIISPWPYNFKLKIILMNSGTFNAIQCSIFYSKQEKCFLCENSRKVLKGLIWQRSIFSSKLKFFINGVGFWKRWWRNKKKTYEMRAQISFGDIRNLSMHQFIRKWFSPESHSYLCSTSSWKYWSKTKASIEMEHVTTLKTQ